MAQPPRIIQQLGLALGDVGLSLADWCALTQSEWEAVLQAHNRKVQRQWEQNRMVAYSAVSPYLPRTTSVTDFMPFPWDHHAATHGEATPSADEANAIYHHMR